MRRFAIQAETMILVSFLTLIFLLASLMPMQNDSWWHLRCGRYIVDHRVVPTVDVFSYTAPRIAPDLYWPPHEWLTQVGAIFAYDVGGLPLLTIAAAALVVAAMALSVANSAGPIPVRCALLFLCMPLFAPGLSVRPQVVSLFFLSFTLYCLVRRRWLILPPIFVVWANAHGGVTLGGLTMVSACVAAALFSREKLFSTTATTAICGLATLLTPMGTKILTFPLEAVHRSKTLKIHEWDPPRLNSFQGVMTWILVLLILTLAVSRRKRLSQWPTAVCVVCSLGFLPFVLDSSRNLAPFLILAIPAISRLLSVNPPIASEKTTPSLANTTIALVFVALAMIVAASAYSAPWSRLGWRPVSDAAIRAVAAMPEPIYNTYDDGGFLLWFAPQLKVFADSRQDPYPVEFLLEADAVRDTGEYREVFNRFGVRSAILRDAYPVTQSLRRDGWNVAFEDKDWIILNAPQRESGK